MRPIVPSVVLASLAAGPLAFGAEEVLTRGLAEPVELSRDADGVVHILAENEPDLFLALGWVHARDRLFQMDLLRRQGAGTLAELVGKGALQDDVASRTLGLGRAAERTLRGLSAAMRVALERYSEGVNAWVGDNALPPEYRGLELETIPAWTPKDSVVMSKVLTFQLSFELNDIERTTALVAYERAGRARGFDGTALYFDDVFRSAPITRATTIQPEGSPLLPAASAATLRAGFAPPVEILGAAQDFIERARRSSLLGSVLAPGRGNRGSNAWVVSGSLSTTGRPLVANDPHLNLPSPAVFYPVHLESRPSGFNVIGQSFAGIPLVIVGNNDNVAWTTTQNPVDVTDVFEEQLVADRNSPSGLSTVYLGRLEPVLAIPESYRFNVLGDGIADNLAPAPEGSFPPATLVVPRRDLGPIVVRDGETALSLQWTGFNATRELDAFLLLDQAEDVAAFQRALRFFDVGSQNFMVADRSGDIAYFASSEIPLREDLQANTVNGAPPFFIRRGSGGNEWLSAPRPAADVAIPHQILPLDELPQVINPREGLLVNANNDPTGATLDNDPINQLRRGGGIFYMGPMFAPGLRAERIGQLLDEGVQGPGISAGRMVAIQSDVTLQDAVLLAPHIVRAFRNALRSGANPELARLGAQPRIAEAVARLAVWDRTTPTGIIEGYDASDRRGVRRLPSLSEVRSSIAATIYSAWRGRMLASTIDAVADALGLPSPGGNQVMAALAHLFEVQGQGASGIDFFAVRGEPDPAVRQDIVVLRSLAAALDLLASRSFAPAFGNSPRQSDYRWGKLHRLSMPHPLGDPFSITSPGNALAPPLPGLPGVPMDGGFSTIDAVRHDPRGNSLSSFEANFGPSHRYVASFGAFGIFARSSLPGGASGVLGSPFSSNLALEWATNDSFPLRKTRLAIRAAQVESVMLVP